MNTINCSPIILCRTKYIDYKRAIYVFPHDLNEDNLQLIQEIMDNGKSLNDSIKFGKVFINDGIHCIIGKYGKINDLVDLDLDYTLDGKSGRSAWGFLGCVIKTTEFIENHESLDVSQLFYSKIYQKYYDEQWLMQEPANGPFHYPYQTEKFDNIDVSALAFSDISDSCYILESDKQNELLFAYAQNCTLKKQKIAFCSNAEYNAHKLIQSNKVQIATASDSMLELLRKQINRSCQNTNESFSQTQKTTEKKSDYSTSNTNYSSNDYHNTNGGIHKGVNTFYKNNGHDDFENKTEPEVAKEILWDFIIGNLRFVLEKCKKNEGFRISVGKYCFYIKRNEREDSSINEQYPIDFKNNVSNNSEIINKKNSVNNKYDL